jgi:anti-anti-sigma factor
MPQVLTAPPSYRTELDLGGVTIMDSSGVNTLLTTHRTARSTGGRLRLAAPSASVARLFQIVGLG